MIIVKVWGGIGNQLFQYVFGQYLHYRFKQDVRYDDQTYISTDRLRKRELDGLDASINWDNRFEFSRYRGIKGRIMRLCFQLWPHNHYIGLSENVPAFYRDEDIYFFQGYWQDHKYFDWLVKNAKGFSIQSTSFPEEIQSLREEIVSTSQSVSIHIRRGDYFTPQNVKMYGVCTEGYYHKAISKMNNRVDGAKYYLFSDDIEWVKHNINLDENTVIIPNYDISQFAYIELMSLCHHHIISNSSFSWWGAVLNEQSDAFVISPQRWLLTTDKTIALNKWTKI